MRIIAYRTLREFVESLNGQFDQSAVSAAVDSWYGEVLQAEWHNSSDVKSHFGRASIISADRIVFNIRGNAYRLIVAVEYERKTVWIKWIGTHCDYDKIDARQVNYVR